MNKPHSMFIYDEANHKSPGDPHALTLQGIPRVIENKYQQAVLSAFSFANNTMWKAAASGIMRGIALAAVLAIGGAVLGGMFMDHADGVGELVKGATAGLQGLTGSPGLMATIAALGATGGAVYEVSQYRDSVHHELAKTRQMMRENHMQEQDIEIGQAKAHEHEKAAEAARPSKPVVHDFDPMAEINNDHGYNYWVEREARKAAMLNHPGKAKSR